MHEKEIGEINAEPLRYSIVDTIVISYSFIGLQDLIITQSWQKIQNDMHLIQFFMKIFQHQPKLSWARFIEFSLNINFRPTSGVFNLARNLLTTLRERDSGPIAI